jgi:hypothetical protein
MDIEIHTKSAEKRRFLEAFAKVYAKLLNIETRKGAIIIATKRDVRSEHEAEGLTLGVDKDIFIFLQSDLGPGDMARVLAHEMVHAKQHLLGQIKHKVKRGRTQTYWMGRLNKNDYLNQPWEVAAYRQESMLMHRAIQIITKGK